MSLSRGRSKKYHEQIDKRHRVSITDSYRQALCQKRLNLGLSLAEAARQIGVHWSTLRKWENGETLLFTIEAEEKLKAFLSDEVESPVDVLQMSAKEEDFVDPTFNTPVLGNLLKRLVYIYRLSAGYPQLKRDFYNKLENVIDETLEKLTQPNN